MGLILINISITGTEAGCQDEMSQIASHEYLCSKGGVLCLIAPKGKLEPWGSLPDHQTPLTTQKVSLRGWQALCRGLHKEKNCMETRRCVAYIKASQRRISVTVNHLSQHWQLQGPGLFLHLIPLIAISPILPCFKHRTEFKSPVKLLQSLLLSKLVSARV